MKRNKEGFILYEVILYLLLATVCFSVIYNEMPLVKRMTGHEQTEVIDWHSSINRLEKLLVGAEFKEVHDQQVSFISQSNKQHEKKLYVLEFYKKGQMLRVRGGVEGHMPIVRNIVKSQFDYDKKSKVVTIKLVRIDKKVFDYVHKF